MTTNEHASWTANDRQPPHAPQGFRPTPAALHTKFQMLFDKHIARPLDTENSRPYEKTEVLLISWKDSDLKGVDEEVAKLESVFKEKYNFLTRKCQINSKGKPQAELNNHLTQFIVDCDSESTLLIVYYAGHGFFRTSKGSFENGQFEFWEQSNQHTKERLDNRVNWTQAEWALNSAKADILGLFDCCHAGELNRTRGPHKFEYLGANAEGIQATEPPGEESFTSALIWAFEQLWTSDCDPFTTSRLQQKIMDFRDFPIGQIPCLIPRAGGHEYISIRPHRRDVLTKLGDEAKPRTHLGGEAKLSKLQKMSRNAVDIRLHFREQLGETKFVEMAQALSHAVYFSDQRILANRVEFLGMLFPMNLGDVAMKMKQRIKLIGICYRWLQKCKIAIKSPAKSLDEWKGIYSEPAPASIAQGMAVPEVTVEPDCPHSTQTHTSGAKPHPNRTSMEGGLHITPYAASNPPSTMTMHEGRSSRSTVAAQAEHLAENNDERPDPTLQKTTTQRDEKRSSIRRWIANITRRRKVTS